MSKINSRKYANIKSMEQLHLERARLHVQMDMKELELKEDYYTIKEMFSLQHAIRLVGDSVGNMGIGAPILGTIGMGYRLISNMISKRKTKRRNKALCEADL